MKNKITRLLLPTVLLGLAIFVVVTRFMASTNDRLLLDKVWTFQADDRIVSTPILVDDQIIFRTASKIYSISAVNGDMNWKVAAQASDITINVNLLGKPIVGNSKFVVSEEKDNSIGIYSTKTGEKIWAVEGSINFINAIDLADNIMIVATHDASLVAYDLTARQKLWETVLPTRSGTPVAVNKDVVILGAGDALRVYDLQDGRLLKEKIYDEALIGEIVLSKANIFISSTKTGGDWSISSLQLNSLAENWVFHAGEIGDPYLSATSKYLSLSDQTLILLDVTNGNVVWKDDSQKYYSTPAFHDENLFFISVQRMFGNNKEMCKIEIRQDAVKNCSLVDRRGRLVTSHSYLLGPLVTDNLLIVPRGSEIVAFTMP